jgi:CRP-like cAMP-binding protein
MDALVAPLTRVRLFQSLSDEQLVAIARTAERALFRPGHHITSAGHDADAAILIVAGACDRVDGGAPQAIEPGSLISELAMLVEHTHGATVVARDTVKALRLPRAAMHDLLRRQPELADGIISVLAGRLTAVADQMRRIDQDLAAFVEADIPAGIIAPDRATVSIAAH